MRAAFGSCAGGLGFAGLVGDALEGVVLVVALVCAKLVVASEADNNIAAALRKMRFEITLHPPDVRLLEVTVAPDVGDVPFRDYRMAR